MKIEIEIEISNLTKVFKKNTRSNVALDDLSQKFQRGAMHGLIGPEGAGKTTLIRSIANLLTPTKGNIFYYQYKQNNIEKVTYNNIYEKIAYMPESKSLYGDLSIEEHLKFFSKLYMLDEEKFEIESERLLQITRLKKFVKRQAKALSGGMYKKLGLMCALLSSPRVLLLDEPTNGVDPISRREFWDLLYQLRDEGILIILATAYMDEAERCTEAHIMNNGKFMFSGVPQELLKQHSVNSFNELFLKRINNDVVC